MRYVLVFLSLLLVAPLGIGQQKSTPKKKTIDELISVVQSSDPTAQVEAIEEIATRGPKAAKAIPALLGTLVQTNEEVCLNAMLALGEMGKAAVPALKKKLNAKDEAVRLYAVWAIGLIGEDAEDASRGVIRLLADKNDDVRRKAAYALGRINPDPEKAISVLTDALKDKNQDVRQAATTALTAFGAKAVPALVDGLKDAETRQMALTALGEIGHDAEKALPALYKLFIDPKAGLQSQVAQTMGKIGSPAVAYLKKALDHKNNSIRQSALQGLREVGGAGVPVLVDALGSKHDDVRQSAAQQLGYMRVTDRLVVIGLAYALKDKYRSVRLSAAYALQSLGSGAKAATPYLQKGLLEGDRDLQRACFYALINVGANPAETLLEILESGNPEQQYKIAHLIIQMRYYSNLRKAVGKATPILVAALKSKDKSVRYRSAYALLQIRKSLKEAAPVLLKLAQDEKFSQRVYALQSLGQLNLKIEGVWPVWLDALKDKNQNVRRAAVYGIQRYRYDRDKAISAIAMLMDDEKSAVRLTAVQAFQSFGETGIPYLRKALEDKNESVQLQATQGLVRYPAERKKVLPHLEKLLDSKNRGTRRSAFYVIQSGGRTATPLMKKALKHEDAYIRSQAAWTVWNWNRRSQEDVQEALKAIVPLMNDSDANVRATARNVINNAQKRGVPYMLKALDSDRSGNRLWAVRMLAYYGGRSGKEIPQAIAKALENEKDKNVRAMGFWSLQQLHAEPKLSLAILKAEKDTTTRANMINHLRGRAHLAKPFVPYLTEALTDKSSTIRGQAASVLGSLGKYAKSALPVLEKTKETDENSGVRQTARQAIASIRRAAEDKK